MTTSVISYKLVEDPKPWFDAREHCKSEYNSQLLTIDSEDLEMKIQELAFSLNQPLWIGYNNIYDNTEWKWVDGSSNGASTYWLSQDTEEGKNCVYVSSTGWISSYCSKLQYFVCGDSMTTTQSLDLTEHPIHSNPWISTWATFIYVAVAISMCCICGCILAKLCAPSEDKSDGYGHGTTRKMHKYNGYEPHSPNKVAELLSAPSQSHTFPTTINDNDDDDDMKGIKSISIKTKTKTPTDKDKDKDKKDKPQEIPISDKPKPKPQPRTTLAPLKVITESREASVESKASDLSSTDTNDRENESMFDNKHRRQPTASQELTGENRFQVPIIPNAPNNNGILQDSDDSDNEEKENDAMYDNRYRHKHQPTDSMNFNGEILENASMIIHGSEDSQTWKE